MNRLERSLVITDLARRMREHGSWSGETHLQKCVYFLQQLTGVPTEYPFVLYKHGPYSFELHDELIEMRGNGLMDLRENPRPYGPSLVPTELSSELKDLFNPSAPFDAQLEYVAAKLGAKGVTALEKLSTALLVDVTEPNIDSNAKANRIHELKPHVSLWEAQKAVAELTEIRATAPVV